MEYWLVVRQRLQELAWGVFPTDTSPPGFGQVVMVVQVVEVVRSGAGLVSWQAG